MFQTALDKQSNSTEKDDGKLNKIIILLLTKRSNECHMGKQP